MKQAEATVEDLKEWSECAADPLVSEGYLMASATITRQQSLLSKCIHALESMNNPYLNYIPTINMTVDELLKELK